MDIPVLRRILVPIEFLSPDSDAAIELAAMFVRAGGGELTLLHVFNPAGSMSGIVPGASAEMDLESERRSALEKIEMIAVSLRAQGIADVSVIAEPGYPADRILYQARVGVTDLIVMGTHGRTGLSRLWIGSVAAIVLREAACRVVVTRNPRQ